MQRHGVHPSGGQEISNDCCMAQQQRRANVDSATLSAYVGSWTQTCEFADSVDFLYVVHNFSTKLKQCRILPVLSFTSLCSATTYAGNVALVTYAHRCCINWSMSPAAGPTAANPPHAAAAGELVRQMIGHPTVSWTLLGDIPIGSRTIIIKNVKRPPFYFLK